MAKLVTGGIYMDKSETLEDKYDGKFGLCMGQDKFYFIFNGIAHIEEIVEIGSAHNMKLVHGYTLSLNKHDKKWRIKNSGAKGQPDYILDEGDYLDGFEESLKPFFKVFMK